MLDAEVSVLGGSLYMSFVPLAPAGQAVQRRRQYEEQSTIDHGTRAGSTCLAWIINTKTSMAEGVKQLGLGSQKPSLHKHSLLDIRFRVRRKPWLKPDVNQQNPTVHV